MALSLLAERNESSAQHVRGPPPPIFPPPPFGSFLELIYLVGPRRDSPFPPAGFSPPPVWLNNWPFCSDTLYFTFLVIISSFLTCSPSRCPLTSFLCFASSFQPVEDWKSPFFFPSSVQRGIKTLNLSLSRRDFHALHLSLIT